MEQYQSIAIIISSVIVLLYLTNWFSGAEVALMSLDKLQLAEMKKRKDKKLKYVLELKGNMDRTLIAILIGNNIANLALVIIVALQMNSLFHNLGITMVGAMLVLVFIIFGEIVLKARAMRNTRKIALTRSRPLLYFVKILAPLEIFFLGISRRLIRAKDQQPKDDQNLFVSRETIQDMVSLGETEGSIDPREKDMISKVFRFGKQKVGTVMVPMEKVFCLTQGLSTEEASATLAKKGFTRVPVVNSENELVGVLHSKDLLIEEGGDIQSLIRESFTLESKTLVSEAFELMKKKRVHLAVIEDQGEAYLGIVTMEDLIEQLVGEIKDEYSALKEESRKEMEEE